MSCPGGRARCWPIAFGTVGMRTPVCVYCGSPNPRPLAEHEWAELADWATDHNVGKHAKAALDARSARAGPPGETT